ncbi:hypothetical protein [uncultured Chryseobacterium sp.]|uniref:hypothetical protein n=1 Tax=uncultured Chryseobacterium sp. TaxID=259322 RepID=UPI0025FDC51C|nr:hypothetical protein [uncultured Chryseobacterium sp.]
MNNKKNTFLTLILLILSLSINAQQASSLFVNYEGTGYTGSGLTKSMKLSSQTVGSTHSENFTLNNNIITVGKSGLYKISMSCGVTGSNINAQELKYRFYVNNAEVYSLSYSAIPASGVAEFQKQLNIGDVITVAVSKNFDFPNNSGQNTVILNRIGT